MQYRKLGRTGLKVSTLCLGTMTFGWSADEPTSFRIMDVAHDAGINFIDTADIYSTWIGNNVGGESETIIGNWLKHKKREDFIVATKVRGRMWAGPNGEGLSRVHIKRAVEDSLRRLGTDYIDLYQTHFPDDDTPLEETLSALDQLVKEGKVLYVGASNYKAWELMKNLWVSDKHHFTRFDSLQPHHSLLHRKEFEQELEAVCLDQGVGVIPYSPLAAGFLTGKYTRENLSPDTSRQESGLIKELLASPKAFDVLDVVREIASARNVPISQIALAWQLKNPVISSSIIGARTTGQLEEVLGAVELTLSDEEMTRLNTVSEGF